MPHIGGVNTHTYTHTHTKQGFILFLFCPVTRIKAFRYVEVQEKPHKAISYISDSKVLAC